MPMSLIHELIERDISMSSPIYKEDPTSFEKKNFVFEDLRGPTLFDQTRKDIVDSMNKKRKRSWTDHQTTRDS